MQSSTTAPLTVTSMLKHITEFTHFRQSQQKLNIMNFVMVEFIAELLYWIALNYIGVPNKVATQAKSQRADVVMLRSSQGYAL